jgi:hypothetical protein
MKDINELNDRMDQADEIIENLIKKTTELEKQVANVSEINIPDYSASLELIMAILNEIKDSNRVGNEIDLLKAISAKLDKLPVASQKQIRFLLFPETNQGQYYKIVFGRLIPWGLAFMVATYIFITGYKAIEIYRYNEDVSQSVHYERAWLYLRNHSKKKMLNAMDEAYDETGDK